MGRPKSVISTVNDKGGERFEAQSPAGGEEFWLEI